MRSATLSRIIIAILLSALSSGQLGLSQQAIPIASQAGGSEIDPQSRAIWITARSKNGSSSELSASDLEVKIDGKPVSVSDVRRLSPTLRYCLLLDISGSTRLTRKTQYDAAVALLSKIPRAGRDYGLLVAFNDQAFLDAEGSDPQKLIKGISQDARGATAMYDAMVACSDHMSENDAIMGVRDALRVMFILSDGEDNSSRMTREGAERTLVAERIRVYSIGQKDVANPHAAQTAKASKTLKQFAEATGGKSYLPAKEVTLEQIVDDISSDLASLYAVTLTSQATMPGDRLYKLEIRCGKKDFAVTAPREYLSRR